MKMTKTKIAFLGLLLMFNTSILNADETTTQQSVTILNSVIQSCSEESSASDDNDATYIAPTTATQVNDNTTVIIDSVNNATSTPQCHQYGAFGECLY